MQHQKAKQAQALTRKIGHVERTNDRDYEVEERYTWHYAHHKFKS
jgi:hypothetical protein